jgi:LEA14-like dessication related protein
MIRRLAFFVLLGFATACTAARSPQLTVIGVQDAPTREVVFVQVTNPAPRPMRLTKLEYTFAAGNETVSTGEVELHRDVPANAAIVVEVPLTTTSEVPMTLTGKLTAELDQIVRIFKVSADVDAPHSSK